MFINQFLNFSELLEKQITATNKNGVVGNKGNTIPVKPIIVNKIPTVIKKILKKTSPIDNYYQLYIN